MHDGAHRRPGWLRGVNAARHRNLHSLRTMSAPARNHKSPKPLRPRGAARVIAESLPGGAGDDVGSLVQHPDGWYWIAPDGHQEFGPFATRSLALGDRDRYSEEAPSEGETVEEAEREIGIGDWIDAETGAPAEGQSPPHLDD